MSINVKARKLEILAIQITPEQQSFKNLRKQWEGKQKGNEEQKSKETVILEIEALSEIKEESS